MPIFRKNVILVYLILTFLFLGCQRRVLAEEIILNDLKGQAVNLSQNTGKPAIFLFWTTWCPHCRDEIITLNKLQETLKKEGIIVFAVNINESGYKVQRFFKDYPLNLRVLLDENALAAEKYEVLGVPTYVFLDKGGRVITQAHTLPFDYKSLLFR